MNTNTHVWESLIDENVKTPPSSLMLLEKICQASLIDENGKTLPSYLVARKNMPEQNSHSTSGVKPG